MKKKALRIHRFDAVALESVVQATEFDGYVALERLFNNQELLEGEIVYAETGIIEQKTTFAYNDAGKLIAEKIFFDEESPAEEKEYIYDEYGRLQTELTHYSEGGTTEVRHYYDEDGNHTGKETIDDDGEIEERVVNEYSNGKPVSTAILDADSEETSSESVVYDEKGRPVEVERFDEEGGVRKIFLEYNELDKVSVETHVVGDDKPVFRARNTYSSTGRIERIEEESPEGLRIYKIQHDGNGNMLKQELFDGNENLIHLIRQEFNQANDLILSVQADSSAGNTYVRSYSLVYEYEYYDAE
ncbi:MAG: hypothetical protein KKD31_05920 [Bacteroidetes bacterium]|nr:hypothetical protein [Bacteroidota bacterium]